MNTAQKNAIVTTALAYQAEHTLSVNDMADKSGVNPGYMSQMLRRQFSNSVDGKEVPIGDQHFEKLAHFVGHSLTKEFWPMVQTTQFVQTITALEDSKKFFCTITLIGESGFGKTAVLNAFLRKNPVHTYRVTVSNLYKLRDIVDELVTVVGGVINNGGDGRTAGSPKAKVDAIIKRLQNIKHQGGHPVIIFDEGENMEMSVLKTVKALYDALDKHCSIVIIGTDQFTNKLERARKRNRDGMPQLYRRLKAGTRQLSTINKPVEFSKFYDKLNIEDKGLRRLLTSICDNYGELHDYLEPVLREADTNSQPVTETYFRLFHNLPKYE